MGVAVPAGAAAGPIMLMSPSFSCSTSSLSNISTRGPKAAAQGKRARGPGRPQKRLDLALPGEGLVTPSPSLGPVLGSLLTLPSSRDQKAIQFPKVSTKSLSKKW